MKNPDEKFCRACGEVIKKEAEICPKCGVRQKEAIVYQDSKNSKKSNETALIILNWVSIIFFPLGLLVPIILFVTTKNDKIKKQAKALLIIYGVLFIVFLIIAIFGAIMYQMTSVK